MGSSSPCSTLSVKKNFSAASSAMQPLIDQHSVGPRLCSEIHTSSRGELGLASKNARCRACLLCLAHPFVQGRSALAPVVETRSRTPQCDLEGLDFSTFTGSIDEAAQQLRNKSALAIRLQASNETTTAPPVNPLLQTHSDLLTSQRALEIRGTEA